MNRSVLTEADICDSREALSSAPGRATSFIYITPGEFRTLCRAFNRLEARIKELETELNNALSNNNNEGDKING